jgi:hypothetical protein
MRQSADPQDTATAEQLRDDIDSGRTGDKVRGSDPAMAPLGTDAEAAGTPLSGADLAQARRQEGSRGAAPQPKPRVGIWLYIAIVVAIGVILLGGALMRVG